MSCKGKVICLLKVVLIKCVSVCTCIFEYWGASPADRWCFVGDLTIWSIQNIMLRMLQEEKKDTKI